MAKAKTTATPKATTTIAATINTNETIVMTFGNKLLKLTNGKFSVMAIADIKDIKDFNEHTKTVYMKNAILSPKNRSLIANLVKNFEVKTFQVEPVDVDREYDRFWNAVLEDKLVKEQKQKNMSDEDRVMIEKLVKKYNKTTVVAVARNIK